jgi:hypothetical protein
VNANEQSRSVSNTKGMHLLNPFTEFYSEKVLFKLFVIPKVIENAFWVGVASKTTMRRLKKFLGHGSQKRVAEV